MKGTKGGRPDAQNTRTRKPPAGPRAAAQPRSAAAGAAAPRSGAPRPRPPAEDPVPAAPARPPLAFQLVTLVLALAGLGVSVYLTIAHFNTHLTLACPSTGAINCEKVTTSPESYVLGIPVAVLGLAFFVFLTAITTPWAWRARPPAARVISLARLISVIIGIGFVVYLIYVELFVVDAICLWCTSVHVLTFLLFCLVVSAAVLWGSGTAATSQRR